MTYILKLQLFKNAYSDNHNRIKKFADLSAQNDYYNNLTDKIEIDGNYNKIGDNINIVGDYAILSNYNYGRFKYHDIWFYFSVIDYLILNENKLQIVYNIDYYETARFQYDMNIGKGTINNITTEYLSGKIAKIPKASNGLGKFGFISTGTSDASFSFRGVAVYIYTGESTPARNGIFIYKLDSDDFGLVNAFQKKVENGDIFDAFLQNFGASTLSDIKGAWLVPDIITKNVITIGNRWTRCGESGHVGYDVWRPNNLTLNTDDYYYRKTIHTKRTDTEYTVFRDDTGSILWESPTGYYIDKDINYDFYIDICPTSAEMRIKCYELSDTIVYPLPTINLFNDAFLEYSARQRQSDIELRQMQNEQQLYNGLLNIGGSIAGGTVSGAMAGGPVGAGVGAVGGAVSGTAGSIGGYALNEYYGNKQQDVIDRQYKKAVNNLLLHGDGLILTFVNGCGFVNANYTGELGTDRTEKIIETYGYEINLNYPNVQSYIDYLQSVNGDSYVMGNFEINGHIPDNWKKQIKERFNGGVNFG